ncbi:SDR family NAD(P)-dependent oxidoreductase [Corynebacterium sp.]|uniref:SDR family NAD(P)-dependent oxidoreductase n=1 Tax=Corynebacterium sp. TaxID=1720 RepID=UPI002A9143AD|nr:SDR family NAD(P)-dependent oxidoreductase [Corynebacterium sp.]MDY5785018.1 SDR family NAD(P)-dependent oxidoreductase [Corynebacterium sp.]
MKKALVTGASRGIGRAIALELGTNHHVYVGASRDAGEVVDMLPSAEPFEVDLRDPEAIAAACANIDELDVLVHAAIHLVREFLPALRRSQGLILTINSGAGFHGVEEGSIYCASKYALKGFTDVLRLEEQGRVRVTSLHPGPTDTDMIAGDDRPKMQASDVAKAVRLAVDAGPDTVIDFLRMTPLRK